jgi:hypothetical protein
VAVTLQFLRKWTSFLDAVELHYEPQLKALGLGKEDIQRQTLPDLERSLQRLDEATSRKESFGSLWIGESADGQIGISSTNKIFETDIGPTLLARKALIMERIRQLRTNEGVESPRSLVEQGAAHRSNWNDAGSSPSSESAIKTVLAWGSLSYAFGFFTVTLHTSTLGLPMIELMQPVYIWVGLPLAGVAFFANRILKYFRRKSVDLATEFRSMLEVLKGREVELTRFRGHFPM